MKATEGGNFIDPKFRSNWKSAGKINISRGAYHFYRICKNGIEQAENYISVVPKHENSMPHAIDFGNSGDIIHIMRATQKSCYCYQSQPSHNPANPVISSFGRFKICLQNRHFLSLIVETDTCEYF